MKSFTLLLTWALVGLCTANIRPAKPFNPIEDARVLRKAVKGAGTDEAAINNVWCRRSRAQRIEINKAYTKELQRDLYDDLEDDISGDYKILMLDLMKPLPEYYARVLNNAAKDSEQSEAIVDILLSSTNAELKEINEAYKRLKLDPNVLSTLLTRQRQPLTPNMIRRAFEGARDESKVVDKEAALVDAKVIHDGAEADVENILITRSYDQLRAIFNAYEEIYKASISDAFEDKRKFHEDLVTAAHAIIAYTISVPDYFARRFHESMYRAGTNNKMLIRLVVSRSEIDLTEIKTSFLKMFKQTLASFIYEDTSRDFRDALLAIVEAE